MMNDSQIDQGLLNTSESTPGGIDAFIKNAEHELMRNVSPLAVASVLERLTSVVCEDVRLVTSLQPTSAHVPSDQSFNKIATLNIPYHANVKSIAELIGVLGGFDTPGTTERNSDVSRLWIFERSSSHALLRALDERYTQPKLFNLIGISLINDSENPTCMSMSEIGDFSDDEQEQLMEEVRGVIWQESEDNILGGDEERVRVMIGLNALVSQSFFDRWHAQNPRRAFDCLEKILETSERARLHARLSMLRLRHHATATLAESIVHQGFRTFLDMREITEYELHDRTRQYLEDSAEKDLRKRMKDESEPISAVLREIALGIGRARNQSDDRIAESLQLVEEGKEEFEGHAVESLPDPSKEEIIDAMEKEDRDAWQRQIDWLANHTQAYASHLRASIGCFNLRKELEALNSSCQWAAAASKELEIVARVQSAVRLFSYEGGENLGEDEAYAKSSYHVGTPMFAAKNKTLNCFTGPWMIASFLLECGLDRGRMFYCSVNSSSGSSFAGSHGALLVWHVDGSLSLVDYTGTDLPKRLPVTAIENIRQRREFIRMINSCDKTEKLSQRPSVDHAHIHIAKTHLGDEEMEMHVLPLDQGLTATMLHHVGIALKEEEKTEDARHAFEIALATFPMHVDSLVELAADAVNAENLERADFYLNLANEAYDGHLLAHYYRAIVAMKREDYRTALDYFGRVYVAGKKHWGDGRYIDHAGQCIEQIENMFNDETQAMRLKAAIDIEVE